jgi:Uncharacterized protein conserved in bacteria (DUF2330)
MNQRSHLARGSAISTEIRGLSLRHMPCQSSGMLRRRLPLLPLFIIGSFALASLVSLASSHATTAILPSGTALPLEQRVAVAVSPKQTTIWTNLRVDTAAGPVGLIVPVPPGAALDHSSDAWFEALDDTTAPRIFPQSGATPVCPGTSPDPNALGFHNTTFATPLGAIEPTEATVLSDVAAVVAWANTHGFSISPATKTALEGLSGMRFFAERFVPNTSPFFSSTLRVVLPSTTPMLPLALTQAGMSNLRVTAWFLGAGRATLTGSTPLKLQMTDLQFFAQSQASNYVEIRDNALLAAGPKASVTETASNTLLDENMPIAQGTSSIPALVAGYFQRTAAYFDGNADPADCIQSAGFAADSTQNVSHACPRADLGVVDGSPSCTEAPSGSEVDPAKLRCGGRADDLALALSDLQPAGVWVTRMTMMVPKDTSGQTWPITFAAVAPQVDPIQNAGSISFAGCDGMASSSSSSSGTSSGGPSGGGTTTGGSLTTSGNGSGGNTAYDDSDMSCGCAGPAPVIIDETSYGGAGGIGGAGGAGGTGGDFYYDDTSDDCSGSTESSDPYADTSSSDDCGGSTTESTSSETSSSDEGIDCSGDTSGGGGSSGSGGSPDYTETGSSSESDSSDCTVARKASPQVKPHKRGPRASVLTLGLLAFLAPLRRLTRPRRTGRELRDKLAARRK